MIKMVAFDFDGTVADTLPLCLTTFRKTVSPFVGHELSDAEISAKFGLNEIGMMQAFVGDGWEKAAEHFYACYDEMHTMCAKPFDGIVEVIEKMKNSGIRVALITGKGKRSCDISLDKLNLNLFCDVLTGSPERPNKVECMHQLLEKYGLRPSEFIYVGDAASDAEAAHIVGALCVSAAWAESADLEKLLEVNPSRVASSVSELERILSDILFMN